MSPEEVKAIRKALGCTARELGFALGVDAETIFGWESGERFPTKKHCAKLEELRGRGPSAFPRARKAAAAPGWPRLADPEMWAVFRKLLAHSDLLDQVTKLAASYDDPAKEDPEPKS